jgi:HEAT repeat protein
MRKILVIAILCALCVSAVMIGCANPVNSRQDTVDSRNKQSAINKSQSEIEALIKQLGSDDWQTRENAQMELEKIGLPAEAALKEVAQSPDLEIYNRASFILKVIAIKKRLNFPSDVVKEIPNLYHDLASLDAEDRYGVFLQIAEKNEKGNYKYRDKITNQEIAKLVGDVLLEKGQELDSNQKLNIIGECLSLDAKEAIPEIMKLLNDKNGNVRSGSVYFLCQLGGKEVLPEIMKLINDDDRYVQMSVLDSIIKFDAKETIPKIVKLMRKENDSEIRATAVIIQTRIIDTRG